jgi:host factor-I protein
VFLGWKLLNTHDILPFNTNGGPVRGRKNNKKGVAMAADKANLQDAFLNHVRKVKVPVTIFLVNGVKLQGVITWFDSFCVLLRRDGQSQLVYKSAISTIMPAQPISLYEGEE